MATIKMVAQKANVSIMTVSRVLNNPQSVTEKTKERVLKAIQELGYQPNEAARIMKGKRANILGVLIPDFDNHFYTKFLKLIEEIVTPLGYRLLIASNAAGSSQVENLKYLLSRNVDAIVISSYSEIKDASQYILQNRIHVPTVIIDKLEDGIAMNSIYTDGFGGIRKIVEHLIGLGHRNIAMIKGATDYQIANDRFYGYLETLTAHGIPVNSAYIWEGDYTIESGAAAAEHFISLPNPPTAIVASSDYIAIGAIHALQKHGYRIPDDISVTGYDGINIGELLTPQLTTIKLPIKEIAQKTVDILTRELESKERGHVTVVFEGDLMVRGSTGQCKAL